MAPGMWGDLELFEAAPRNRLSHIPLILSQRKRREQGLSRPCLLSQNLELLGAQAVLSIVQTAEGGVVEGALLGRPSLGSGLSTQRSRFGVKNHSPLREFSSLRFDDAIAGEAERLRRTTCQIPLLGGSGSRGEGEDVSAWRLSIKVEQIVDDQKEGFFRRWITGAGRIFFVEAGQASSRARQRALEFREASFENDAVEGRASHMPFLALLEELRQICHEYLVQLLWISQRKDGHLRCLHGPRCEFGCFRQVLRHEAPKGTASEASAAGSCATT